MSLRGSAAIAIAFVAIAGGSAQVQAQEQVMPSIAEVARQAEAAKATAKKATKTYTNASLTADPRGAPAPAPPAPDSGVVSKSLGKPVSAEEIVARSEATADEETAAKESEQTWRNRASSLRQQIDKMRERLEQLTTPNALTEESPLLKAANNADITNARNALDGLRKQWVRLEASAIERKIPLAWIEPAPQFQ